MNLQKNDSFKRMGFINRLGCIAIAVAVLLILLFGTLLTHSSLKKKQGDALVKMDNLRNTLINGLQKPRPLRRYMADKPGFEALMVGIGSLKRELEDATSLAELDELFEAYQYKTGVIMGMDLITADEADKQAVRNTESEINGVYNHYKTMRPGVVEAVTKYNNSLSGFPESMVGKWFGLTPLESALVESDDEQG